MTHKEYHISWDKILSDAAILADKVKNKSEFKGIIAITRGGLIPAGLIAQQLNIKTIETVGVSSYEQQSQRSITITKELVGAGDGDGWLVIDDLVDSGETARVVKKMAPKALYGVLYAKPQGEKEADFYVEKIDQETWVFFPWEIE